MCVGGCTLGRSVNVEQICWEKLKSVFLVMVLGRETFYGAKRLGVNFCEYHREIEQY